MRFEIAYSRVTFIVLTGSHLLAALSVCLTSLPVSGQVLAVSLLIVSAGTVWRDYGRRSPLRIRQCSISNQGSILSSDSGSEVFGLPRPIYRSEFLLVLEFLRQGSDAGAPGPAKRKLILSADALEKADFCRLQRYLRFES